MGVFYTFYLMFKSNSAEAVKGNKEVEKSAMAAGEATKKTNEESVKLGKAFTNAIEDATRALAAYVSYQSIKSGILNAQEFNRELGIQTRLWGQNSSQVAGYGAAVKAAGGSVQEIVGWYDAIYKQNAAIGAPTKPLGKLLDQIHNQVKGLSPEQAQFIFDKYGISGVGTRALLSQSDGDYQKSIRSGLELANNTQKASAAAEQFGKSWDNLSSALLKFWGTVDEVILPVLSKFFDALTEMFNYLGDHKEAATAFFGALVAGAVAFTAAVPSIVAGFSAMAAGALAAAAPVAAFLAQLAAVAAVAGIIVYGSSAGGEAIGHWANRKLGRGDANGVIGGTGSGVFTGSSVDFWRSNGFSSAAAAGITANENRESGGRAGARGDGGSAVGLFQWHPDRVAKILKNTGIDVRTAGREDQLKAALWELQSMGLSDSLKNSSDPAGAAALFSNRFERPANGVYEARLRAANAMQIAGSTPFGSLSPAAGGGSTVTIQQLNVHSQATDAAGIAGDISQELKNQIRATFAQNNDAVAY